jgi:hypothetical protein
MISLEPLAKCSARELVKVKADDRTEWAIVGARDPGYSPLIFLTGENAPFVVDAEPERSDFSEHPVAKYGTEYRFVHDPNGPCQIGNDTLSKTVGSLVLTQDGDWHLVVNKYGERGVRWFELASGKVRGEPGSHRIAFGKWDLCVQGLRHEPREITLLSHPHFD